MSIPEGPPDARYQETRDRAGTEVDRLAGVARLAAAAGGEQQAATDIAGMVGGLDQEELAGLLTAAIIRLAGHADSPQARPSELPIRHVGVGRSACSRGCPAAAGLVSRFPRR